MGELIPSHHMMHARMCTDGRAPPAVHIAISREACNAGLSYFSNTGAHISGKRHIKSGLKYEQHSRALNHEA